jgi:diphosphomevalonate decarboxylase
LARQGSGSSCRSIPDGFVEWHDSDTSEGSYCETIFPETQWDVADVVAVVSTERKDVATSVGHKYASTSPFYESRIAAIPEKIKEMKQLIQERNFKDFGELIEAEALNMHAIMITSSPSLLYWLPGSLQVMKAVKQWRADGLPVYFTLNTGQDVHVICEGKNASVVEQQLKDLPDVKRTIVNKPAKGARVSEKHLF